MEYLHTLEELLEGTLGPLDFYSIQSMRINSRPSEWVVSAMAQRIHVGANLRSGMKYVHFAVSTRLWTLISLS